MAGQAPRGSRGHGEPSRRASSLAVPAAPSADGPGRASKSSRRTAPSRDRSATLPPRQTYRKLTSLGLSPEEAANLTAFICGIPIEGAHWSLRQVNQLLFLRELRRTGRFGPRDGRIPRPN
jgi:hypothetical protein